MARTLEQKIAGIDAQVARLRTQERKLETGQKIVLGGMLLNAARQEEKICKWLLEEVSRAITRDVDKKRLAPLIDELNLNLRNQKKC